MELGKGEWSLAGLKQVIFLCAWAFTVKVLSYCSSCPAPQPPCIAPCFIWPPLTLMLCEMSLKSGWGGSLPCSPHLRASCCLPSTSATKSPGSACKAKPPGLPGPNRQAPQHRQLDVGKGRDAVRVESLVVLSTYSTPLLLSKTKRGLPKIRMII